MHAEQNALLQAAKIGYSVQGSHCYSTLRPCFGCLKELYQAGVTAIRYLNEWTPSEPIEAQAYDAMLEELAGRGVVVAPLELPEGLLTYAERATPTALAARRPSRTRAQGRAARSGSGDERQHRGRPQRIFQLEVERHRHRERGQLPRVAGRRSAARGVALMRARCRA